MTSRSERPAHGFTLVELMVTVAIVAILAAIAYPLYLHQMIEARRSAAESLLMDIAQREQQYFLDQRQYDAGCNTDAVSLSTTLNVTIPANVTQFYKVCVTTPTTTTFTAQATPIPGTAQASDQTLTILQDGTKQPASYW